MLPHWACRSVCDALTSFCQPIICEGTSSDGIIGVLFLSLLTTRGSKATVDTLTIFYSHRYCKVSTPISFFSLGLTYCTSLRRRKRIMQQRRKSYLLGRALLHKYTVRAKKSSTGCRVGKVVEESESLAHSSFDNFSHANLCYSFSRITRSDVRRTNSESAKT